MSTALKPRDWMSLYSYFDIRYPGRHKVGQRFVPASAGYCTFEDAQKSIMGYIRGSRSRDKAIFDKEFVIDGIWDASEAAKNFVDPNHPTKSMFHKHSKFDQKAQQSIGPYMEDKHGVPLRPGKTEWIEDGDKLTSAFVKKRMGMFLDRHNQPREILTLNPLQYDVVKEICEFILGGAKHLAYQLAPRFGKTNTALALSKEIDSQVIIAVTYHLSVIPCFEEETGKWEQFKNYTQITVGAEGWQEALETYIKKGSPVILLLSMNFSLARQGYLDAIQKLKVRKLWIGDEADFGLWQPAQAIPLKEAVGDDIILLMSGTGIGKASLYWPDMKIGGVSYTTMTVARNLQENGGYPMSPNSLKHFTQDPTKLLDTVPVKVYNMGMAGLFQAAKNKYPNRFEVWQENPSWLKITSAPTDNETFITLWSQVTCGAVDGLVGMNLLEMQLSKQFGGRPKAPVMMAFFSGTKKQLMEIADIVQRAVPAWLVVTICGPIDGEKGTTNKKAVRETKAKIKKAQSGDNPRPVWILSIGMGARSFGIKELDVVQLCFDGSTPDVITQKMLRVATSHSGRNKIGRVVCYAFDPNCNRTFQLLVLQALEETRKHLKLPSLQAAVPYLTSTFFDCTKAGAKELEISTYLEGFLESDIIDTALGKIILDTNIISTELYEKFARVNIKSTPVKQECIELGKLKETLPRPSTQATGTRTPEEKNTQDSFMESVKHIRTHLGFIMCFAPDSELTDCLDLIDTLNTSGHPVYDELTELFDMKGIRYEDIRDLLREIEASDARHMMRVKHRKMVPSGREHFAIEPLFTEMLGRIDSTIINDPTKTLMDPSIGGGQSIVAWVALLRAAGKTDKEILNRTFGFDHNSTRIRYVRWLHGDTFIAQTEIRTLEDLQSMSRTFDVIVGNPPYQDPTAKSNKKLWKLFVKKSVLLLKEEGHVALISPQTWMESGKMFDLITKHNSLLWANTNIKHYFPNVNSTFVAFVMQKGSGKGRTIIDGVPFNLSSIGTIPVDLSEETLSILQKTFGNPKKFVMIRNSSHHNQRRFFGKQSKKFCYPIFSSVNTTLWSHTAHPDQFTKKVIITSTGNWKPFYDEAMGTAERTYYRIVHSKAEGERVIKILDNKLFHFILGVTKRKGFFNTNLVDNLPNLDTSINWTDAEIYKHFNITKKEQAHIEAYLG